MRIEINTVIAENVFKSTETIISLGATFAINHLR